MPSKNLYVMRSKKKDEMRVAWFQIKTPAVLKPMSFHNLFSHIMKFHKSITDTLTCF